MIKKIFHLADIHIRNLKRHKEYREVFNKLKESIRVLSWRDDLTIEEALIVIPGDIVHSKLDMSPELIDLVSKFLMDLADLHEVVIIPGNHDLNLNNPHRLDALTPVIRNLDNPKIFYSTECESFRKENILFTHFSISSGVESYPTGEYVRNNWKRYSTEIDTFIALYHGPVDKAVTDIGFEINNDKVTVDLFKDYDITLLGDIHKRQFLDEDKTILYPGSLIQQNYGESVDRHGYALWDVESRTCEFIDIHNDYGYYTLDVIDGKYEAIDIPAKHPRIRVRMTNTPKESIPKILLAIKNKYGVKEVSLMSGRNFNESSDISITEEDVRDPERQSELIIEYLGQKTSLSPELQDSIRSLNRDLNSELPDTHEVRGVKWKPLSFSFSNMFSYGEDNTVAFHSMKGLYGLFAENASGKSSIVDALLYCCFDKCSKTNLAGKVLNSEKDFFESAFTFELNGVNYMVSRNGKKQKSGAVKVDVEFCTFDEKGEKTLLNGTERKDTNRIIRQYLGTYEEMVLTALSLQRDNDGFIDMTQKERNDLLSKFLDLSIFEELLKLAKANVKESETLLKEYKKEDYSTLLSESAAELDVLKGKEDEENEKLTKPKADLDTLLQLQDKCMKEYKPVSDRVKGSSPEDKEKLYAVVDHSREKLGLLKEKKEVLWEKTQTVDKKVAEGAEEMEELSRRKELLSDIGKERTTHVIKHNALKERISKEKAQILSTAEQLQILLQDSEYDPNCQYCVKKNESQEKLRIELENSEKTSRKNLEEMTAEEQHMQVWLDSHPYSQEEWDEILQKEEDFKKLLIEQRDFTSKVADNDLDIKEEEITLREAKADVETFLEELSNIEFNQELDIRIDRIKEKVFEVNEIIDGIESSISTIEIQKGIIRDRISRLEEKVQRLFELEEETKAYNLYIEAVKHTGVPLLLIEKALPVIQSEVNQILSDVVEFSLEFKTDGKNIDANISYGDLSVWPIEMTSGMERFISQLAIRQALTSVSTLPKPNFIVIDEGWGTLSANNISNIAPLLDILKSRYDFSITISHIDSMRDMVDNFLEIKKENGFSSVNYG